MAINWKKTVFVVCDIVSAAYLLLAIVGHNCIQQTRCHHHSLYGGKDRH